MAASLAMFCRSAPLLPAVFAAKASRSTLLPIGFLAKCIFRIASRSLRSGRSMLTRRSNRPGRSNAGSSTSLRLVAARTITFVPCSNPSISTKIWLSVCSRSSWPPPIPLPRRRPTASISSIKIMHGAFFLALANKSRTRLAPTPTNISTNSEPEMLKNGASASPATARASMVLPVPGGPTKSTPLGILAPTDSNFLGNFKNSTTSCKSCLASSEPATSLKTTLSFSLPYSRARLLPKDIAWLPWPWALLSMMNKTALIIITGSIETPTLTQVLPAFDSGRVSTVTLE